MTVAKPWIQILGAGQWQLPVIARAKAIGLNVLAVDRDANQPGYTLADRWALCDLMDEGGQLRIAREFGVMGLLSPTSDIGVYAAAEAAAELGLAGPGRHGARIATDKAALFAGAVSVGFANRRSQLLLTGDPAPAWFGDCIVKPVDNQSGRGVSRVSNAAELPSAVDHAVAHSPCGRVLVEDWLAGDEYVIDGYVYRGRFQLLGLARKRRDPDNPTVAVGIDYLMPPERDYFSARLIPPLQALLDRSGWGSSLLHVELIDSPSGPQVIDLAARGGGALIFSHALPTHLGTNLFDLALRLALGELPPAPQEPQVAVVIEFLRCPHGCFEEFVGLDEMRAQSGVVAIYQAVQAGDRVSVPGDKDARPGLLICQGADTQSARDRATRVKSMLRVRLAGETEPRLLL